MYLVDPPKKQTPQNIPVGYVKRVSLIFNFIFQTFFKLTLKIYEICCFPYYSLFTERDHSFHADLTTMNSFSEESYVTDPTTTQPTLFLTPLSRTGYLLTALYLTLVGRQNLYSLLSTRSQRLSKNWTKALSIALSMNRNVWTFNDELRNMNMISAIHVYTKGFRKSAFG